MAETTHPTPTEAVVTASDPTSRAVDIDIDVDIVEVWGQDSFPASDPPANW